MDRLNILILHKMGDPLKWRNAVKDLEFLLPQCYPDHNYLVHPTELPLPSYVRNIDFHAIIMGPTFLYYRNYPRKLKKVLQNYDFIRESTAYKIALPQDEYNCSAILDKWLVDWNVDQAYSVLQGHNELLYPNYSKTGRIKSGYTGYISDKWIEQWQNPKHHKERAIDVSYRAKKLPPYFGRIGFIKGVIGERFIRATKELDLRLDISTNPNDMILGEAWNTFIENSKHCLASNSGSSLIDPYGNIREAVIRAMKQHPQASFEEIEALCFAGEDNKHQLTAISPRNIEAALAETVQIMTPDEYSGLLVPDRDYIPLMEDCSNITEVVAKMTDLQYKKSLINNCKENLLSIDSLRANFHATSILESIKSNILTDSKTTAKSEFRKILNRYNNDIAWISKAYWPLRRSYRFLKSRIASLQQ